MTLQVKEILSGFGSIIGRSSFQRAKPDAIRLLSEIVDIHRRQSAPARTPVLN